MAKEATMNTTHQYICYCGCNDTVNVEFTNGFAGTEVRITLCETQKTTNSIITAAIFPRSFALKMTPANQVNTTSHINGLVTFNA
jgi:hypothetical protein